MNQHHPIVWLKYANQQLGLVPSMGGSVAAWKIESPTSGGSGGLGTELLDLLRPWDGNNPDRYSLASFPMVPWSNRITGGGFDFEGMFYPIALNREGEPYPIHGDGWLQPWQISQPDQDTLVMSIESKHFSGNPYHYSSSQTFQLVDGGMYQSISVTHLGDAPMPYGLGLHPWFLRTAQTRLQALVDGIWLSGADPIPTRHTKDFPPTTDINDGMDVNGSLIDNAYTGWDGSGTIQWPEKHLKLTMTALEVQQDYKQNPANTGYCLIYRPVTGPAFCFEPITHPIDAFHDEKLPGLKVLRKGETLQLRIEWKFETI